MGRAWSGAAVSVHSDLAWNPPPASGAPRATKIWRRQRWIISASLATAARETQHGWPRYAMEPVAGDARATRLRARELAAAIGDRVAGLAYKGDHDITWIGLTTFGDARWSLSPVRANPL